MIKPFRTRVTVFIVSLLFLAIVSVPLALAAEIPSDHDQDVLIRSTLATFNDANMSNNYAIRPAGPAAVTRPADTDDPQPRRDMVEHLARRLADQVQRAATAGTGLMLDIQPDVPASEVRRQARSLVSGLGAVQ